MNPLRSNSTQFSLVRNQHVAAAVMGIQHLHMWVSAPEKLDIMDIFADFNRNLRSFLCRLSFVHVKLNVEKYVLVLCP